MIRLASLAMVTLLAATPAQTGPFGIAEAIADDELAVERGGFLLPNGLALNIGIAIETRVDGQLALRTALSTDGSLQIFGAGGSTTAGAAPPASVVPLASTASAPGFRIDRNGAGTVVTTKGSVAPNVQVVIAPGPAMTAMSDGSEISVTPGGPGVPTTFGVARLEQTDRGSTIVLVSPTLELRHLIGAATGVVVANTADNRTIDTVATINVDLLNASSFVGSDALRVDGVAASALAMRNPL